MMLRGFLFTLFVIFSQLGNSQEKYANHTYGFKIEFPDLYVDEVKEKEEMKVISISSSYQKMIFLASIFDYKKAVPADELNLKEIEALAVTAEAFNAKFKAKKIEKWQIGAYEGLSYPIKGKVTRNDKTMKFYGKMYVVAIKDGIEFRLTILAPSKKSYHADKALIYIKSASIN